MHLYDEHNHVLRLVFKNIEGHLLILDQEENDTDAARYLMHRKFVNEMLRPLNFVVGVNHFNRHCILPLVEHSS